jgi:serine/threonine protein phosphatase 1
MRLAVGDVHGRVEALKEVLIKSKFDFEKDELILLGDICDGGYNTYEVVEELLKIKHLVFVQGNHDRWWMNHIRSGWAEDVWLVQGGNNTLKSYRDFDLNIPVTHQEFFNKSILYYELEDMLFVHGGFDPKIPLEKQDPEFLLWDRTIIDKARSGLKTRFKKVFLGHTTTQTIGSNYDERRTRPICIQSETTDYWFLDTGAGWNGRLTLFNIDTEQYWQSQKQEPAR